MGFIYEIDLCGDENEASKDPREAFRNIISRSDTAIYEPVSCEYDRKILYYPCKKTSPSEQTG